MAAAEESESRSPEYWRQQLFKQAGTSTSSGRYQTRKQKIQTLRDIERQVTKELPPEELREADGAELSEAVAGPLPEKMALAVSNSLGYPSKPTSPPGRASQQGFQRPHHKPSPAIAAPPVMPNTGSMEKVTAEVEGSVIPLASLKQEPVVKPQPPPAVAPQRPRSLGRPLNGAPGSARHLS
mmetsp:Transcript_43319/g.99833  ORF Transcript_43319/g.99833 Transcript_43319/m.99833 type:complete len:182 (-) Transcript_43319:26-571(-)